MIFEDINEEILTLGKENKLDVFRVGKSLFGKDILGVHIGNYAGHQVLIVGGMEANEYITSFLILKQIKYMLNNTINGGIYFIPCINPDGVSLTMEGIDCLTCDSIKKYLQNVNNDSKDFSLWKANGSAVDLNCNFNVIWGQNIQDKSCPSKANFKGFYPESEREIRDLLNFIKKNKPNLIIDYHANGDCIYYGFETQSSQELAKNLKIANNIAEHTEYKVIKSDAGMYGLQDYSISFYKIPAITILVEECLVHSSFAEVLEKIFQKNKDVPIVALNTLNSIYNVKRVNKNRLWKGLCLRR